MRILFFRLGAIGDTLLTTPAVRKARELFPDADIHYMAGEAAAQLLENTPDINKIIVLKTVKHFLPREFGIFFVMPFLMREFGSVDYDYFVDFESSYFSTYVSFFIHADKKIGHRITDKKRFYLNKFYSTRVNYEDKGQYAALRHLALIKELKPFDKADLKLVLKISYLEKIEALQYMDRHGLNIRGKKIMLCLSSTWKTKSWPEEYWIELIGLINNKFRSHKIIILTAPADPAPLLDKLRELPNVHVWTPVELRPLAALLSCGDALIANDGAMRHMANALDVKSIGLFGPTSDTGWAYEDENNRVLKADMDCRPCHKPECVNNMECLKAIKPEQVLEHLSDLLK